MYITAPKDNLIYNLISQLVTSLANVVKFIKSGGTPEEPPVIIDDVSTAVKNSEADTRTLLHRIDTMFPEYAFPELNRTLRVEAEYTPLASFRALSEARKTQAIGNVPKQLDSPAELILGAYCSRVSYTLWVSYNEFNEATIIKPLPTRGKFSCGPDILPYDYDKQDMPEDTTRAIKIIVGTKLHNSHLRGVSVQYYE